MERTRKRRGTGRVTLQDVANFAGVGTMTVSRALRVPDQVSDRLREKIEQAIEELGYIPNRMAGTLASGHSDTISVLVPSVTDKTSSRFMHSLQEVLNKSKLQLLLCCHDYNQHNECETLMALLQNNPMALVIFGTQLSEKNHLILEKNNIPVINVISSPFNHTKITIQTPFFEASHKMTEHLLVHGYKNIGFIGAHMDNRLQRLQLNGWHKAMLSHYLNSDLAITTPDTASLQFGRYALAEMLLRQPELDAVICSHEEIALGIMFECQRRLLKIPGNIAVACLDGTDSCDHMYPSLTSIRIDYKIMGKAVGNLLIDLLNDNPKERLGMKHVEQFSYQLELRQST